MPGANERALEKAAGLPADALILDLEDAVAPDAKADGPRPGVRGGGVRPLRQARGGHPGQRRSAHPGTTTTSAAAAAGPAAVVVPKVDSADAVHAIEKGLEAGGAPTTRPSGRWSRRRSPCSTPRRWPSASERLTVLVMGTNDLAKELRAEHVPGRQPLARRAALALLAARATGKVILDGVYNDIKDAEGFEAECVQGRQMGFDGKTLIHPSQVEPCNRVFAPTDAEVERARAHHRRLRGGRGRGRGVVTVDGRMVENLHVEQARRTLASTSAIAALAADWSVPPPAAAGAEPAAPRQDARRGRPSAAILAHAPRYLAAVCRRWPRTGRCAGLATARRDLGRVDAGLDRGGQHAPGPA